MGDSPAGSEAHDRILEAADRLFFEQGFRATGINQIIREADVAKATLYQHFPSKEELGRAYLARRRRFWRERLREFVDRREDPVDRVLALFDFLETHAGELCTGGGDVRGCPFQNIAAEFPSPGHPLREVETEHRRALRGLVLTLVLAALGRDGEPAPPGEGTCVGEGIYLLFEGCLVASRSFNGIWPVAAARAAALELLRPAS